MNRPSRNIGFTLTELLVAISLMVILMLAVNVIFKTTADTISAGQALSTGMRDLRSVQSIIKGDLDGAAIADGPFFMIRSSVQAAFKNQKDQLADADYLETDPPANRLAQILSADLGRGVEDLSASQYGNRTFRTDILGFFSRGLFQRQTGNDGTFAASMTSNEAYVWYGHMKLPDNSIPANYRWPGFTDWAAYYSATNNPNNFYASQWVLGRCATLLRQPGPKDVLDTVGAAATDRFIYDANLQRQAYFGRAVGATSKELSPLAVNSYSTFNGTLLTAVSEPQVQEVRYDLVGTTLVGFRGLVADHIANVAHNTANPWWDDHFNYRFQANPFPSRPLTAASAAQTSPIFLPNCSQFVVEYAGDFTTQDAATGAFTNTILDRTVDFVVIDAGTLQERRSIRWYGMPRSTTGNVTLSAANGDVAPLRDFAGGTAQPFERVVPTQQADYAQVGFVPYPGPNTTAGTHGLAPYEQYICAWGPDTVLSPKPTMLRILIKPEDPNGKVNLPWQEMIFKLP